MGVPIEDPDMMALGAARSAARQWSKLQSNTYMYYFTYVTKALRDIFPGAPHASEINYVFKTLGEVETEVPFPVQSFSIDAEDRQMSDLMSAYWVHFAKAGNPNNSGLPDWPAYSEEYGHVLELGSQTRAHRQFAKQRLDYFDRL